MDSGIWILNLIQIFRLDLNLDPNIWIWILKKSKLVLLKKMDLDQKFDPIIWI